MTSASLATVEPSLTSAPARYRIFERCASQASDHRVETTSETITGKAPSGTLVQTVPTVVHEVLRAPGQPLDHPIRTWMESRFGHDFSRVRVHTGSRAAESAQALRARAYAVGDEVVFAGGNNRDIDRGGRRLLVHELAHVVQQAKGGVTPFRAVSAVSDLSEQAAERAADLLCSGGDARGSLGIADALVAREPEEAALSASPAREPTAPTTSVLQEFDVDAGEGRLPWDLDRLVRQIADVLGRAPNRYIEVVGYYSSSADVSAGVAGAAREAARKRADRVCKDLLERVPALRGRARVATRDLDLVRERGGEQSHRQIGVEWGPPAVSALATAPGLPPASALPWEGLPPLATPRSIPEQVPPTPLAAPIPPLQPGTTAPYPAKGVDAWRVFLSSPPGKEFKEKVKAVALRDLKRFPPEDSSALPKIVLAVLLHLPPFVIGGYGLAAMSEKERQEIIDVITSDVDISLLRPLPEKTQLYGGFEMEPGLRPRTVITPVGNIPLPAPGEPRAGGTALGADLRLEKPALKTTFKPKETVTVTYTTPDGGWWIDLVSSADESIVVQRQRIPNPTKKATMELIAPVKPAIYTVRLVDRDGTVRRSTAFQVL